MQGQVGGTAVHLLWRPASGVVAKAEHIDGKENPRFVVTSLKAEEWAAQALYEELLLCARGDGEPDQRAVQFVCQSGQQRDNPRQSDAMHFSAMAYVLVCACLALV